MAWDRPGPCVPVRPKRLERHGEPGGTRTHGPKIKSSLFAIKKSPAIGALRPKSLNLTHLLPNIIQPFTHSGLECSAIIAWEERGTDQPTGRSARMAERGPVLVRVTRAYVAPRPLTVGDMSAKRKADTGAVNGSHCAGSRRSAAADRPKVTDETSRCAELGQLCALLGCSAALTLSPKADLWSVRLRTVENVSPSSGPMFANRDSASGAKRP